MIEKIVYAVVGGTIGALLLFAHKKYIAWRERVEERRALVDAFSCDECGARPDKEDKKRIEKEAHLSMAVGWLCPRCAPELDLVTSGLTFRVIDVAGESPRWH